MSSSRWDYSQFKDKIYRKTGLNLDSYKDRQMERRVRQLMQRERQSNFETYFTFLDKNPDALERFLNYLTINTSEFYRDEAVYRRLFDEIIPGLLEHHPFIKIWSAGCSIGAEPYSLAVLLHELKAGDRYRIVATDIDVTALKKAEEGCYSVKQLGKMPEQYISRYFERRGSLYCVQPVLRRNLSFRRHNLLRDPPERDCHLILCRNVFIYFKQKAQEELLSHFSSSLVEGGFLVLGLVEYINEPENHRFQKKYPAFYQKQ